MATVKFSNSGISKLAGSLTNVATSFSVTGGDGAKFPALSGGNWHLLTLSKVVGNVLVEEVIKATARTTDTFTVVRAQEGTTATTFAAGDLVELRMTAGATDEFAKKGDTNTYTGSNDFTASTVTVPTVTKGDNDNSAASTGFVKSEGVFFGAESSATGTATLAATVVGLLLVGNSASAHTQTLPLANSVRAGDLLWCFNTGAGTMTVQRQGSDTLDGLGGATSTPILQAGSAIWESNGSSVWRLVGGFAHIKYAASVGLAEVLMDSPTSQTVANNSVTQVTNWTSRQNVGNHFNATTGVFTAPRAGKYRVSAAAHFAAGTSFTAAGQEVAIITRKNGAQDRILRIPVSAACTIQPSTSCLTYTITLAAGDTLDICVYQTGGASTSTAASDPNTFVSISEQL